MITDINSLQFCIMSFVKDWANNEKTPIPRKEIIKYMQGKRVDDHIAINAIHGLLSKGYIRKAYSFKRSVTLYVMTANI